MARALWVVRLPPDFQRSIDCPLASRSHAKPCHHIRSQPIKCAFITQRSLSPIHSPNTYHITIAVCETCCCCSGLHTLWHAKPLKLNRLGAEFSIVSVGGVGFHVTVVTVSRSWSCPERTLRHALPNTQQYSQVHLFVIIPTSSYALASHAVQHCRSDLSPPGSLEQPPPPLTELFLCECHEPTPNPQPHPLQNNHKRVMGGAENRRRGPGQPEGTSIAEIPRCSSAPFQKHTPLHKMRKPHRDHVACVYVSVHTTALLCECCYEASRCHEMCAPLFGLSPRPKHMCFSACDLHLFQATIN